MQEPLLFLVPLLVLGVVLALGFAGCRTLLDIEDPVLARTVVLRAQVPAGLTLEFPGVTFLWRPPGASAEQTANVGSSSVVDGFNEFRFQTSGPAGGWVARCLVTALADGQSDTAISPFCPFDLLLEGETHFLFEAVGTPLVDFEVLCRGVPQPPPPT